uniref:Uncharacterized protein n=1 Tax=Micrurus lemniscatus lemniscatus TaxID=129467 RepID=A0A2D4JLT8_MICLE
MWPMWCLNLFCRASLEIAKDLPAVPLAAKQGAGGCMAGHPVPFSSWTASFSTLLAKIGHGGGAACCRVLQEAVQAENGTHRGLASPPPCPILASSVLEKASPRVSSPQPVHGGELQC